MRRRSLLAAAPAGLLGLSARAETDTLRNERTLGSPAAKVVVWELFSLTCPHCGTFARDVMPRIRADFIDTGKVFWVFRDYPIGDVARMAARVARYMPPDRYVAFAETLLATQKTWGNYDTSVATATAELWKLASAAGMPRATFETAIHDTALRDWIGARSDADGRKYLVSQVPTFVVNGAKHEGMLSYDQFRAMLNA